MSMKDLKWKEAKMTNHKSIIISKGAYMPIETIIAIYYRRWPIIMLFKQTKQKFSL